MPACGSQGEGVCHAVWGRECAPGQGSTPLLPASLLETLPSVSLTKSFWEQPCLVKCDHFYPCFTWDDSQVQNSGVTSPR